VRNILVAASIALFLAGFAWSVAAKEEQIKSGATIIVRLAPRDPRAFLLGDYMDLSYTMNREVSAALSKRRTDGKNLRNGEKPSALPHDGLAVVRLDADKVASFIRLDDGGPLHDDERRLYFRVRGSGVHIAAPAFYFQEGDAEAFERAEYGELRVDAQGKSLLVHLLDDRLQRIQPQRTTTENHSPSE